jgi:phosphopantothenoylcysteine decarboxylase/phosphopantothenate--cysteine ligase
MKCLVTAGPTREPIDPVRFISNRSSGRMGFAVAQAAAEAGHEVVLVAGPVSLPAPPGVTRIDVTTADEMFEAVRAEVVRGLDAAVMAAAVADYRPVAVLPHKLKKSSERIMLELERAPDILGAMRGVFGFPGRLIGFAAETENVLEHARGKLERKGCDLIVANDISRPGIGFDGDWNEVILLFPSGEMRRLPRARKLEIARFLVTLLSPAAPP